MSDRTAAESNQLAAQVQERKPVVDLEAAAARMLMLAEWSAREHIDGVSRSQADKLMEWARREMGETGSTEKLN